MRIPLKQERRPDSAMPKIPVHQTVNYNQSLNYRLLGRAFHTIKSYLKHSDLVNEKTCSRSDTRVFCNRSLCPFRLCRVRTYFRSQIAISESEPVYCTSLLSPTVQKWFFTLYRLVCCVFRFAVEQSLLRNGSAIRTF